MELHKTCTVCPRGCQLRITGASQQSQGEQEPEITVKGQFCRRGEEYGRKEARQPMRILTTTVRTAFRREPRLPVKTSGSIPLSDFPRAMARINSLCLRSPVQCGEVVECNFLGDGVDLVATEELPHEAAGTGGRGND